MIGQLTGMSRLLIGQSPVIEDLIGQSSDISRLLIGQSCFIQDLAKDSSLCKHCFHENVSNEKQDLTKMSEELGVDL